MRGLLLLAALSLVAEEGQFTGAGWGAFGLSGLILGWLFLKHLPEKDAQLKEYMQAKDARLKEALDAKDAQAKELLGQWNDERERDRIVRHEQAKFFQLAIADFQKRGEEDGKVSRKEFKETLHEILAHCKDETSKMGDAVRAELRLLHQQYQQSQQSRSGTAGGGTATGGEA